MNKTYENIKRLISKSKENCLIVSCGSMFGLRESSILKLAEEKKITVTSFTVVKKEWRSEGYRYFSRKRMLITLA